MLFSFVNSMVDDQAEEGEESDGGDLDADEQLEEETAEDIV